MIDVAESAPISQAEAAAEIAFGAHLRSYRFDKYKTKEKTEKKPSLARLTVATNGVKAAKHAYRPLEATAAAVFMTRDLVSEPANVIYPETLAAEAERLAEFGVEVEILDEQKMRELGMNALLAVGQGSARPSRLVVMQWHGAKGSGGASSHPLAFVGKGRHFRYRRHLDQTGRRHGRHEMGYGGVRCSDRLDAAARDASRPEVNAVGVVGLVENMPSGTAQRPGDIVKSMSGQTIEVLNTDAEGRLVLADALWYARIVTNRA